MPNWCDNRLLITGDKETIMTFIEKVTNKDEQAEKRKQAYDILGNLYPTPQELVDTMSGFTQDPEKKAALEAKQASNRAKYGYQDWYEWNCANWGTKWGDSDTFIVDEDPFVTPDGEAHIQFGFQSAWSPPIQGIAHIATLFPTLEFALAYYEEGMDFYGLTTFTSDGDYLDNCEEISSIEGMAELDAIDEDDENYENIWEKRNELVSEARDNLLENAGW